MSRPRLRPPLCRTTQVFHRRKRGSRQAEAHGFGARPLAVWRCPACEQKGRGERDGISADESSAVLSAIMMFRRFERALRHAIREEQFGALLGAAMTLVVVGTLAYTLGEDWSLLDGFYFAVATLTTSSIADPELVITSSWLKIFTAFYVLVGIGILVEVARQLGFAMIELQRQDHAAKAAAKAAKHPVGNE
jgi:Ion channel